MARLSTRYDEELNEQVFFLRGDEYYARATKTLLELGSPSIQTYGFNLPVTVNVLRDRDEGTIAIYDNGEVVSTITDWSSQSNARTIVLNGLAFDVEHNIVARYMGNNKCSQSSSTTETISVKDTSRYQSKLTLKTGTTQFDKNTSYTDTIILSNPHSSLYNENQPIEVLYDGELIDTVTTDENGEAEFTISDVGEEGTHNIGFHFNATRNLTDGDLTVVSSVGYQIQFNRYDKFAIYDTEYKTIVRITDYFGNLQDITGENDAVLLKVTKQDDTSNTYPMSRVAKGVYSKSLSDTTLKTMKISSIVVLIRKGTGVSAKVYSTETMPVQYITPQELILEPATPRLYKNETNRISVHTMLPYKNIPLIINGELFTGKIPTNGEGVGTFSIKGDGIGDKTETVTLGKVSNSITLGDYLQYWDIKGTPTMHSPSYVLKSLDIRTEEVPLRELYNYFEIVVPDGTISSTISEYLITGRAFCLADVPTNIDYELIISGLSTTKNCGIVYLPNITVTNGKINEGISWNMIPNTAHNNETWRIERVDNTVTVYRNNAQVQEFNSQGSYQPCLLFVNTATTQNGFNVDFTGLSIQGR